MTTETERDLIREEAYIDKDTCLFPDSHAPGHPADMKFHVLFRHASNDFEDLTEQEMIDKYAVETIEGLELPTFSFTSFWHHWYAP